MRGLFLAALLIVSMGANAEAYIVFDKIEASGKTFDSVALNVDDSVLFSSTSGGIFYKQGGASYVLPVWGACHQAALTYTCTIETGDRTFRLSMNKKTKVGKMTPVVGVFDSMASRNAALVQVTAPLPTK